eukprot:TRINITY_DN5390_c0_g1_i1.p1 TRINITY_DN5390_c0_g1~~TRINITY_DN5390_c0_g1_i1.p1  ORF type:complete len:448 (+),score=45.71 TRINITY_DN5390_c0_g1_i1:113-1456(+)
MGPAAHCPRVLLLLAAAVAVASEAEVAEKATECAGEHCDPTDGGSAPSAIDSLHMKRWTDTLYGIRHSSYPAEWIEAVVQQLLDAPHLHNDAGEGRLPAIRDSDGTCPQLSAVELRDALVDDGWHCELARFLLLDDRKWRMRPRRIRSEAEVKVYDEPLAGGFLRDQMVVALENVTLPGKSEPAVWAGDRGAVDRPGTGTKLQVSWDARRDGAKGAIAVEAELLRHWEDAQLTADEGTDYLFCHLSEKGKLPPGPQSRWVRYGARWGVNGSVQLWRTWDVYTWMDPKGDPPAEPSERLKWRRDGAKRLDYLHVVNGWNAKGYRSVALVDHTALSGMSTALTLRYEQLVPPLTAFRGGQCAELTAAVKKCATRVAAQALVSFVSEMRAFAGHVKQWQRHLGFTADTRREADGGPPLSKLDTAATPYLLGVPPPDGLEPAGLALRPWLP